MSAASIVHIRFSIKASSMSCRLRTTKRATLVRGGLKQEFPQPAQIANGGALL